MNDTTTVVGLDVHKATIVVAVLPSGAGRPTEVLTIENEPRAVERLVRRLATRGPVARGLGGIVAYGRSQQWSHCCAWLL